MAYATQLEKAIYIQFQWVRVLFGLQKVYTFFDKVCVGLFAMMHICFFLIFVWSSNSTLMAQLLSLALQAVAFGISIVLFATLEEYADKMTNAAELELSQNPALVASTTVRLVATIHAFFHSSYILVFLFLLDLGYTAILSTHENFFVDATSAWRDLRKLRKDRQIRAGYNLFLFIAVIVNIVYMLSL